MATDGWSGWVVHIGADHVASSTVMAEAVPSHGRRIMLAERVTPEALGEAIREFFEDLRGVEGLPENLINLTGQPTPTVLTTLVQRLQRDASDPATKEFNDARAIIADQRWTDNLPACR